MPNYNTTYMYMCLLLIVRLCHCVRHAVCIMQAASAAVTTANSTPNHDLSNISCQRISSNTYTCMQVAGRQLHAMPLIRHYQAGDESEWPTAIANTKLFFCVRIAVLSTAFIFIRTIKIIERRVLGGHTPARCCS